MKHVVGAYGVRGPAGPQSRKKVEMQLRFHNFPVGLKTWDGVGYCLGVFGCTKELSTTPV